VGAQFNSALFFITTLELDVSECLDFHETRLLSDYFPSHLVKRISVIEITGTEIKII